MVSLSDMIDPNFIGKSLLKIYDGVINPDQKMVNKYWCIFSLDDLKKKHYAINDKMISIASKYQGMGWYEILSYIPETDSFCFCIFGESGEYDSIRQKEYYESDKYDPTHLTKFESLEESSKKSGEFSNILDMKFKDFKMRTVQYTYDDLAKFGFFNDIKIIKN